MQLTIDRKIWYRGNGYQSSSLLLSGPGERKQCCVGILCTALGVPDADIVGQGVASRLAPQIVPKWIQGGLSGHDWDDIYPIYIINDDPNISDAQREERLTQLFAKHDIQLIFIN